MLTSKRLDPGAFLARLRGVRAGAAARRMADVRAQPAERLASAIRSSTIARSPRTARRWATCSRRWSRWVSAMRSRKLSLERPLIGAALGLGRVCCWWPSARSWRWCRSSLGLGVGALHVLSADDRQCLLLHRRRAGRGRLLDLGRADVDQSRGLEARESGQAGAAADVRQRRRRLSLGLDRGRRRARDPVPDPAGRARAYAPRSMPGWRACSSPGRCTPSSISG